MRKVIVAIAAVLLSFGVMGFTHADAAVCAPGSLLSPVESLVDGVVGNQADAVFAVVKTVGGIVLSQLPLPIPVTLC